MLLGKPKPLKKYNKLCTKASIRFCECCDIEDANLNEHCKLCSYQKVDSSSYFTLSSIDSLLISVLSISISNLYSRTRAQSGEVEVKHTDVRGDAPVEDNVQGIRLHVDLPAEIKSETVFSVMNPCKLKCGHNDITRITYEAHRCSC